MVIYRSVRRILPLFAGLILSLDASAQFYSTGDDPHSLNWSQIETKTYRIIFPQGLDSLAKVYARKLESKVSLVGTNAAYIPGEAYRKKTPVLLHTQTSSSNGVVTWAPQRMELYSTPEPYNPTPLPWEDDLAAHESRHVAQMQFGNVKALKPFNWLFGEMFSGFCAGLYIGKDYLEGDAVIAETALSNSGRGRTADFLNYYMIAQDQGKPRTWYAWRNGSQHNYTPNHYALGYLYYSGLRYFYDSPSCVAEVLKRASARPYDFNVTNHMAKKVTGLNRKEAFDEIISKTYDIWKDKLETRNIATVSRQAVNTPKLYSDYSSNVLLDDGTVISLVKSFTKTARLVSTDSTGSQKTLCTMATTTSRLKLCSTSGRIWWSEARPDPRWQHRSHSTINCYDLSSGKCRRLTNIGKLFNPCPSPDGKLLACVNYPAQGGCRLCIIDSQTGNTEQDICAPDGLQLVELAWIGDKIFASAISAGGFGIYALSGNSCNNWSCCLEPEPVTIRNLDAHSDLLYFTSDINGVNELYSFDPGKGKLLQKTSTRYGASEFAMSSDGRWICFSMEGLEGKLLHRIDSDALLDRSADFSEHYRYPVADGLSKQNLSQRQANGQMPKEDSVSISEPKPYRKVAHLIRPHSWAPVYVDADAIVNRNFENALSLVSPGVMLLSQNTLGTAVCSLGYSYHKDRATNAGWRHSGHFMFSYSGLYPVFQFNLDFNDRAAYDNCLNRYSVPGKESYDSQTKLSSRAYLSGKLKVTVPLKFASRGWNSGITPGASWTFSNDCFDLNPVDWYALEENSPFWSKVPHETDFKAMHSLTAFINAYHMLGVAHSAVYPRFGIGAETGVSLRPGIGQMFSPQAYAHLYGYLPGFVPQQGLRLSFLGQTAVEKDKIFRNATVNTLPRGFSNNNLLLSQLEAWYPDNCKLTADYAIPVWLGDLNIFGGAFYVKRMVLTPHFDYAFFGNENLWSAGSSLSFDFGTILWLKYNITAGVSVSYNSGSLFNAPQTKDANLSRVFVAPVFSISF